MTIKLARWVELVKRRFWSTFSHFDDDQIDAGCDVIRRDWATRTNQAGEIAFQERLVLIVATRTLP